MSEWGIALIAAGSAILGSITTGFFAWKAGHRQAAAAEAAGNAQANALISTVQATLDDQRLARQVSKRQQAFSDFFYAADTARTTGDLTGVDEAAQIAALHRAQALLEIELYSDTAAGEPISDTVKEMARTAVTGRASEYQQARGRLIREASLALQTRRIGDINSWLGPASMP